MKCLTICCLLAVAFAARGAIGFADPPGEPSVSQTAAAKPSSPAQDIEGVVKRVVGPLTGRLMFGAGVNSDAGVAGELVQPEPIREHAGSSPRWLPRPAPSLPAAPRQVQFDVLLLGLDVDRMTELGLDLRAAIAQPAPQESEAADRSARPAFRVISTQEADGIVKRLHELDVAKVMSRPKVLTLENQTAHISVETAAVDFAPSLVREYVNGAQRDRIVYPTLGTHIELTPVLHDANAIELKALFKHTRRIHAGREDQHRKEPRLSVNSVHADATLKSGQTWLFAQADPTPPAEDAADSGKDRTCLLLVVTPTLLPAATQPLRQQTIAARLGVAAGVSNQTTHEEQIELRSGETRRIRTRSRIHAIDGFDPNVVEVTADGPRELRLHAKATGITTLSLIFEDGEPETTAVFVTGDTREIEAYLARLYPDVAVETVAVQDSIVVRGTVPNPQIIEGIVEVAERFYPVVINHLQVEADPQSGIAIATADRHGWALASDHMVSDTGRRMNHLRQAAENLRAAGNDETARQIESQVRVLEEELRRRTQPGERQPAPDADLRRSVRELRGEVRQLRLDVNRLIELLQSEGGTSGVNREKPRVDSPEANAGSKSRSAASELVEIANRVNQLLEQGRMAEAEAAALDAFRTFPDQPAARELYFKIRSQKQPNGETPAAHAEPAPAMNRRLATLIEEADTLFDELRYAAAEDVARAAVRDFPQHPAAEALLWKARFKRLSVERSPYAIVSEDDIREQLAKPISLKFNETRLADACHQIAETAGISVVIDNRGLLEEGVTNDMPVSLEVDGVSLRSALKVLLEPLQLDFVVEDEVLEITSRQRARGELYVRIYPVADLLRDTHEPDGKGTTLETLSELIARTIEPDSWAEMAGPGRRRPDEPTRSLVIRQSPVVHAKISELLSQLRRLKGEKAPPKADPRSAY